ncbi:hypothetical protein JOM56_007762 [Amanita muscaria]
MLIFNSHSLSLQPATRPSQYPLTVLWNFEDIPSDAQSKHDRNNPSRPKMKHVIRHEDGTKISRSEWNALRGSGKYMRTQTDFMHDYPALWQETVKNLEAQQPLLALCTNHWKADHLLAYIMRSSKKRKDGEEDDDDDDDDDDDNGLKVGNAAQTVKQNIPLGTQAFMNAPINQGMTGSNHIDVSFIVVDPSIESLKMFFRTDYSHIAAGSKLMDAFELNPTFGNNEMSEDVKGFLCRLETADPNDPSIDDDEKGLAWGHCQFTANPVPWRSVFASWGSIRKPANACLVIAAAMRTCSVARHVYYQGSEASEASFTADAYLQELTELILEVWISADGVCNHLFRHVLTELISC